jgi:hypothetical protein
MSLIILAFMAASAPETPEQVRRHQATVNATIIAGFSTQSYEASAHQQRGNQRKQHQIQRDAAGNFVLE